MTENSEKEEAMTQFESNVAYLRRNVAPDDIYIFSEQLLSAAHFFLLKWNEWEDLHEICEKDEVANAWVSSLVGLIVCREEGVDIPININLNWKKR